MTDLQTIIEKTRWYNVGVPCSTIIDPKKVERIKMLRYKNESVNGLIYKTRYYEIEKCTSKSIRNILVSKLSVKPICEMFWKRKFNDYICLIGTIFGRIYH